MKKFGFTLAEVLITLAIIGVVAALTIPSVVANTQQQEFKTGLRKAVSVLNSAITMNMAIDGETPYENRDLYRYLARHMSVIKNDTLTPLFTSKRSNGTVISGGNIAFYTTDGMRFEFVYGDDERTNITLYENPSVRLRGSSPGITGFDKSGKITGWLNPPDYSINNMCGSYGLSSNTDNTKNAPCLVIVDVNGDRKPYPKNVSCYTFGSACQAENIQKYADANGKKLTDIFPIMITDKQAIPYGVAAQKAMYEAQK